MKIVNDLRSARAAIWGLPFWIKTVMSINFLMPGIIMWYLLKTIVFTSLQMVSFLEMAKAAELFERHGEVVVKYLESGQTINRSFSVFLTTNVVMGVLGLIAVVAMWYPTSMQPIGIEDAETVSP